MEETLKHELKSGLYCVKSVSEVLDHKSFTAHCLTTIAKGIIKFTIVVLCHLVSIRHSYDVLFRKTSILRTVI